jgi:hypothetical protein
MRCNDYIHPSGVSGVKTQVVAGFEEFFGALEAQNTKNYYSIMLYPAFYPTYSTQFTQRLPPLEKSR